MGVPLSNSDAIGSTEMPHGIAALWLKEKEHQDVVNRGGLER